MKRFSIFALMLVFMLTPLFLIGCTKTKNVDGVELSAVKIVVSKDHDSITNKDYEIIKYSCVVKNTTDHPLKFTVMYSYRRGSILSPSVQFHNEEITLASGEGRDLTYTTDKIYGGILDEKRIIIKDVKEAGNLP